MRKDSSLQPEHGLITSGNRCSTILQSTGKSELNPEGIKADIRTLLNEPDAGIHRVRQRLAQFDREIPWCSCFSQRHDLSESEVQRVIDQVETAWYKSIHAPAALTAQAKARYDQATMRY